MRIGFSFCYRTDGLDLFYDGNLFGHSTLKGDLIVLDLDILQVYKFHIFKFPNFICRRHQKLVRGFLRNAKKMIEEDGQIHVTHKSNAFFLKWDPKLGTDQGLCLIQEVNFKRSKYLGYQYQVWIWEQQRL